MVNLKINLKIIPKLLAVVSQSINQREWKSHLWLLVKAKIQPAEFLLLGCGVLCWPLTLTKPCHMLVRYTNIGE